MMKDILILSFLDRGLNTVATTRNL